MSVFTPVQGLIGGSLIGLSATTLLLGSGDILGASGIISSLILHPKQTITEKTNQWKLVFISSFFIASTVYVNYADTKTTHVAIDGPVVSTIGHAVAGFLVGMGTKLANGCTSGHGICGLARLSYRSIVAVATFMCTGVLSASLIPTYTTFFRNISPEAAHSLLPDARSSLIGMIITLSLVAVSIPKLFEYVPKVNDLDKDEVNQSKLEACNCARKKPISAVSGALFAIGLGLSGMTTTSKVLGFLDVSGLSKGLWDATLMLVMGGGLCVSMIGYQFVPKQGFVKSCKALTHPLLLHKNACFSVPSNQVIDRNLVFGSTLFGLGWGIGGICPGPALFLAANGFPKVLYFWWPSFIIGNYIGEQIKTSLVPTSKHVSV